MADDRFEVLPGEFEIGFGGNGLLLPGEHVLFVEFVAVVDLLEIKLEFVFVGDGDIRSYEHNLVVV